MNPIPNIVDINITTINLIIFLFILSFTYVYNYIVFYIDIFNEREKQNLGGIS